MYLSYEEKTSIFIVWCGNECQVQIRQVCLKMFFWQKTRRQQKNEADKLKKEKKAKKKGKKNGKEKKQNETDTVKVRQSEIWSVVL